MSRPEARAPRSTRLQSSDALQTLVLRFPRWARVVTVVLAVLIYTAAYWDVRGSSSRRDQGRLNDSQGEQAGAERFSPSGGRPFSPSSPFNTLIPPAPALDPLGPDMVAHLSSGHHPGVANLYDYGVPIWDADASTPRHTIDCLRSWGQCGLEQEPVPIPVGATATPVTKDGAMVVIDWSTRRSYEFYEAENVDGAWRAGWGSVVSIDGTGAEGQAVGAGVSRLAGVVRTFEMAQGHIDHALVFSTDNACQGVYRYPATKTDGRSSRADCIPEGTRVQLDPAIDVDSLPGLTPGERTVARALQRYGAYAIDNGGARMAFIFETPSGEGDPYAAVGFGGDYYGMDRIPWGALRVLKSWDGAQ